MLFSVHQSDKNTVRCPVTLHECWSLELDREQAVGGEPGASDDGAAEMFWTHSVYYWFGSLAAAWIINCFTAAPKESNQWEIILPDRCLSS